MNCFLKLLHDFLSHLLKPHLTDCLLWSCEILVLLSYVVEEWRWLFLHKTFLSFLRRSRGQHKKWPVCLLGLLAKSRKQCLVNSWAWVLCYGPWFSFAGSLLTLLDWPFRRGWWFALVIFPRVLSFVLQMVGCFLGDSNYSNSLL